MKKVFLCLVMILTAMMLIVPVVAMAEGELPTEPFTWEYLATIAGATLATTLIVQLLKLPIDKVWKIPTRLLVFVIACMIMIVATYFTTGLTWSNAGLSIVNAVIVALAAFGAYEVIFRKFENK